MMQMGLQTAQMLIVQDKQVLEESDAAKAQPTAFRMIALQRVAQAIHAAMQTDHFAIQQSAQPEPIVMLQEETARLLIKAIVCV